MRKTDCSPEEWAAYCAKAKEWYHKHREAEREKRRQRSGTDEARAKRRAYDMRPEVKAKRQGRERASGYHQRRWAKAKGCPDTLNKRYAEIRAWRTGMDAATFKALLILQNNARAICLNIFEATRKGDRQTKGALYPCADHCHDGGGARGLLCNICNAVEGLVRASGLTPKDFSSRLHYYLAHPPVKRLKEKLKQL